MKPSKSNVIEGDKFITENIIKAQEDDKDVKVTNAILVDRFGDYKIMISKYDNLTMKLQIADQTSLKVAEAHVQTLTKILNDIESVRKVFKEPYLEAGRKIDRYADTLKSNFSASKTRLVQAVTNYKVLEQARLRAEEEAKKKEAEAKMQEKLAEVDRLARIRRQVLARIFGGEYTIKSGETRTTAGCITEKDCQDLQNFLHQNFPRAATFAYIPEQAEELLHESQKMLTEHWSSIVEANSSDPAVREKALEKISLARVSARMDTVEKNDELEAKAEKEYGKDIKHITKESTEVGKGLRNKLTFEIYDESMVPADMKSVDERKVKDYIRRNTGDLLVQVKEGKQPIPGINVKVEVSFVSR
jgi:hypothetical protein